jgi:hypothetical protein
MSPFIRPNIEMLREAYSRGENITQLLSATYRETDFDRQDIIEIAYDIQSGSYIREAMDHPERLSRYALEIKDLGIRHIAEGNVILDCGAGELTTVSVLSEHFPAKSRLVACDISLSRLRVGRRFAERFMRPDIARNLSIFVADMGSLPLADNSVDVVFTSHALEPNHGRERELLTELLRVARRKLILFEPSWENASSQARARMEQHGYVRGMPQHIQEAGGHLVAVEALPNPLNPLNPTYCYVVEPIDNSSPPFSAELKFQCPRSGHALQNHQSYWWSCEGGWAYPEIDGIPCLREKHGVLMSHA